MIRINLLSEGRKTFRAPAASFGAAGGSREWTIVYGVLVAVWAVGALLFYFHLDGERSEAQTRIQTIQNQIKALDKEGDNVAALRAQLQKSQELEKLVTELDRARTGPTRVLLEISRILSKGGSPTVDAARLEELRRDNPLAGYNRNWDNKRLWLTSFEEKNKECSLKGIGRSNEDVAEFLRRLSLSELFEEVTLQKTKSEDIKGISVPFIGFELTGKVRY